MKFLLQEYWSGLFPSSRGSSWLRYWTQVSCIGRWILYNWATRETLTMISKFKFSHSVMSNSLWPHELQHASPPCPSPTPGVCPNPCALSRWCIPAISSSVIPFSSCPQSFPALGSFPVSQLFTWGGPNIGVSALASFLPKKSQGWSPLEWTDT